MAKDYQKEAEKLRIELAEVRRENDRLWNIIERRNDDDRQVRDKFKELLIEVLGK